MIVHMQKVMPILSFVLVLGIDLGGIPWGLRHPQDVPSVDPSTLGRKTLYELASLKYCYSAAARVFLPEDRIRNAMGALDVRSTC